MVPARGCRRHFRRICKQPELVNQQFEQILGVSVKDAGFFDNLQISLSTHMILKPTFKLIQLICTNMRGINNETTGHTISRTKILKTHL